MNSQTFFCALALVIFCLIPTTIGYSSTSHAESITINSSNSSQALDNSSTSEESQQPQEDAETTVPSYYSPESESNSMDPNGSQRQDPTNYYDQPADMTPTTTQRNSTYPPLEQSYSDNPNAPYNCPGPADPTTGEAVLDSDENCAIVCYNNLILNDAGDACICPPTFQFDPVQVKCICRSPFVQRGSKCVLLPSQAPHRSSHKKRSLNEQIPMGFGMLHGKYLRTEVDVRNCPDNEIACPMSTGGFECLDPEVTLDSCGGCLSTTGVDCRNMTGANGVGCNKGVCVALSCAKGFRLIEGTCVAKNIRKP